MSAQGGTIARGTIHLPMWPVAGVLAAMVAAAIGLTVLTDARPDGLVTSVTDAERLANSSAAVREQGAVGLALPAIDAAVLESSNAAVREQGASIGVTGVTTHISGLENAGAWGATQAVTPFVPGLENPGAWVATQAVTPFVPGLENPGAYAGADPVAAPIERYGPIVFGNGEPCHQCR